MATHKSKPSVVPSKSAPKKPAAASKTAKRTTANSFRLTAAEMFKAQQDQQLRAAGILIKSYRDYTSAGNPSKTQATVAAEAGTKQSIVSDLERGKKVPGDLVLQNILDSVKLPVTCSEGKAVFDIVKTIRDTQDFVEKLPKHKPK